MNKSLRYSSWWPWECSSPPTSPPTVTWRYLVSTVAAQGAPLPGVFLCFQSWKILGVLKICILRKISLLRNHSMIWTEIARMLCHHSWDLGLSHTVVSTSTLVSVPKYHVPLSPPVTFPTLTLPLEFEPCRKAAIVVLVVGRETFAPSFNRSLDRSALCPAEALWYNSTELGKLLPTSTLTKSLRLLVKPEIIVL